MFLASDFTTTNLMLPWLKLIRLPNLPSAIANVLAAFLLVNQSWAAWPQLLMLLISSSALYSAGMVLNDVFDIAQDTAQRPNRPIPSGQIDLKAARRWGFILLAIGIVAAVLAGIIAGTTANVMKCAVVSSVLAGCIYLYDGPAKRTWLAPLLMGACRSLNIMLGGATAASTQIGLSVAGFPIILWAVAFAIGLLITGVTLLSRNEASENQSRFWIVVSSLLIVGGIAALAIGPTLYRGNLVVSEMVESVYPFMVAMISITILRRLIICAARPTSRSVKFAIIATLRSLILFDAAVCFLARPDQLAYSLVVLSLLLPVLILSRWMYAT